MTSSTQLKKCDKPDCFRQTSIACYYCCAPCRIAADGKYEIGEHSHSCDGRHATRGEWREYAP